MALNPPDLRVNGLSISSEFDTISTHLGEKFDSTHHEKRIDSTHHEEKLSPGNVSLCEETFRPSYMVKVFSFHWLASIGILAAGVYLSVYPLDVLKCNTYHVIVYLQLGFWVGTYMINEFIKPKCRKMENQNNQLYKKMSSYRKKPLLIVSLWNTTLIVTQKFAADQMKVSKVPTGPNCDPVEGPPQIFLLIFCGLQTAALTMFYIPAIAHLIKAMNHPHPQHTVESGSGQRTPSVLVTRTITTKSGPVRLPLAADCVPATPLSPQLPSAPQSAPVPDRAPATLPSPRASSSRPAPAGSSLSPNCVSVTLPSPRPLSEAPLEEQLQTYAQWFKKAQIENDKLWRQAKKLGIKPEDLRPSDRPEHGAQ